MAVTVQMPFTSAVTEMYQDAFVGSSMENGTTMITFDLRKHDLHQELGTQARLSWRKEAYHVDMHALSTFHNPITYRCIVTQGSSLDAQNHRRYFTPEMKGVSTSQHVSHSVVRFACYLAVVCGVSLRHIARLFSVLFLLPTTKALRYLRKKGMGKHRRGSNSEAGMRLLRRLEKNHDGIRSAVTRQYYMQIYQAIKYLSLDVADFLEQGPQITELPDV